ncbi:magnesium-translocating P-type ATPase [Acidovorax sp. A1169]|uniref:magnesium-translocating P-type ATPase n=1 Tax=Acidovorax sp. A1169 TaxID=3059524 RepID=UPI002737B070|nr:magnesium-translocating P-type ATPase [Acidovorax sp. A1169]MDP4078673.1 magnesium-translocating P-type ATPase [Acidovorax sp. A1169]
MQFLTQSFSRFLRRRRALAHFGRRPMLGALAHGQAPAASVPLATALLRDAAEPPADALRRLISSSQGLSPPEAAQRLARDGPNEVDHEKPLPGWLRLWHCYTNPFNLLLTVLAGLSWLSADAGATLIIGLMVGLSTLLRFVQEGRAHQSADGLRSLVGNTATVLRPAPDAPLRQEIPVRQLVAGDVVALSAGDMVPADCRLITARDLFVAQSAMTGESAPVEKYADPAGTVAAPLEARNLVFMGTSVVSGTATALVLATGPRSYFGTLAARAQAVETVPNAFQAGVNSVSWLLIRFAAVMVPVVFVLNGWTKGDWLQAFLFAVSVAVGLTPEMLPMIVTSTLAKGAMLLSRRKVVVKRLDAIQNFGAMDVLCTDKTGTLTQDRIAVARKTDAFGQASAAVLNFAFLNSYYQTGLKNLLDHAVLAHVDLAVELRLKEAYSKVDEIPFDFVRRRMSVVVCERDLHGEHHELICKGALEEVLAICTQVRASAGPDGRDSIDAPLDAAALKRVLAYTQELGTEGLRVVAVAMKELPPAQVTYAVADEAGLTLVGVIAFVDPPKESAAPALKALAAHGIRVKVLSGDNAAVTAHVCAQVGLPAAPLLLGAEVEAMDDVALQAAAEVHDVFAKLAPLHKERIVRALRARGHVVGFMGDGINDAPALRAADIGISVDTAVDIAKEAADIILLEKSLLVLDQGVIEGRTTFCNMLKYIRMTASSNFGNVLSVLVASAFLPFLPMLPLQLLVQNLLYDVSQTGIPFDKVDAELVAQPLKWNPSDIGRFMLFFGPLSSVFDIMTFAVMWWAFAADSVARQGLFQSGWFVVGMLTQTLVVHLIRTPRLPFVQSWASAPLLTMTGAIAVLALWLPMGPLASYFKFEALPLAYFGWLAGILAGYFVLTTLMKRYYIRRFGWQ